MDISSLFECVGIYADYLEEKGCPKKWTEKLRKGFINSKNKMIKNIKILGEIIKHSNSIIKDIQNSCPHLRLIHRVRREPQGVVVESRTCNYCGAVISVGHVANDRHNYRCMIDNPIIFWELGYCETCKQQHKGVRYSRCENCWRKEIS